MTAAREKHTTVTQPRENHFRAGKKTTPNVLLRDARKGKRWTQEKLAEEIGVSPLTVSRWERGETSPDSYARSKLCRVFGKNPEELGLLNEPGLGEQIPSSNQNGTAFHLDYEASLREEILEEDPPPRYKTNLLPWYVILTREREVRSWSQGDLARKMWENGSRYIDPKTISRWERGMALPSPQNRQLLMLIFGKSAEELGFLRAKTSPLRRPIPQNLPILCGDCERPEITATLATTVIDLGQTRTTFYLRFTNGTAEDGGLKFESLSLTDPNGDFLLGHSVGSFLLGAGQSIPLAVVFDWIPQPYTGYSLNIVLIRPNKWRNSYQPLVLRF